MKARSTIFLIALLSFFSLATLHASISYEVQTVQTLITGSKLQIDFQIKSTGDAFELGTSTFIVNYNSAALGPNSGVKLISGNDGPWSNPPNDDYDAVAVSKSTGYAGITVVFVGGDLDAGPVVGSTFTTVGSITIPITDATQLSQCTWRGIGSVTQVQEITSPGVSTSGECTDITSSGTFDGPSDAPLPVELTSFTALAQGRTVNLSWATKTEINNHGFDVERQVASTTPATSSTWTKVGSVTGKGTTNTQQNYSYSDVVSEAGSYNYRLKQIDNDGNFTYSSEVTIKATLSASDYQLSQNYPNPFNPSTKFNFALKTAGHVNVKIYNSIGQEVVTLFDGTLPADEIQQVTFDGSRLASGIYFYVLRAPDRVDVKKMLLMK
ncbi:MAG: T9SS type A sorting domain-containing protein [Bacteroidota bacterium]